MSLPTSLLAYASELDAFRRANATERGIRIEFPDERSARAYLARLHQARVLDRKENKDVYAPGDPMFGKSDYDTIRVSKREDETGKFWLYLEKNEVIPGFVEEL